MRPTDVDAKNQANNHGTNMKHLENTEYFYSRSLLAAVNECIIRIQIYEQCIWEF